MSKEVEKLIKIQGAIDKDLFHLTVEMDLENEYKWKLFLFHPNSEYYFSKYNRCILSSKTDTIEDLFEYLNKHNGFKFDKYVGF